MTRVPKGLVRILISTLLLFESTGSAAAQGIGQVTFSNFGDGVNAPVFDATGNPITAPSPYVADLFWSVNTNATMDELTAVGDVTAFAGAASFGSGYFFGGSVNLPSFYILAQVRAWDTNYGSTYYRARDHGGEFGFSNPIIVLPVPAPGTPAPLTGLQSFRLQRLPRLSINLTPTNTLLFSWPVEVTSYALQQNSGFDPTNWTTLTNTPVVVGSQNEVTVSKPQEITFYRLISQYP